jgi:uncharacterized Zn finger protein
MESIYDDLDETIEDSDILSVFRKLHEVGRLNDAITLAEHRQIQARHASLELATWLAPLEESPGKIDMALLAYQAAFEAQPAIAWYRHLKRLTGANWVKLRPALMEKVIETQRPDTLTDIHLEEGDWDAAIAIAEKYTWSFDLLEKVADTVIPHRPDWVIRVSLKQSGELIAKTKHKLYPTAAKWLGRAKKAYLAKGAATEWQTYIANLRATYTKRPALQKALTGL